MSQIAHENKLVEKYRDRAFVLLGVNGDPRLDAARKAVADHSIGFSSWWDNADSTESIAFAYGVTQWPTNYVLDHVGVIRYKNVFGADLERAVDELVTETETDGSQPVEQSHAPEPAAGPVSNGKSSPPAR